MNLLPIPAAPIEQATPPTPMPGNGIQLTINEMGYSYNAPVVRQKFRHPFRPAIGPDTIKFSAGLVDIYEPKIKGVPISGGADQSQPALKLDAGKVNKAGESWAVLEVEPDTESDQGKKGILDATARIEIVQLAEVNLHDPKIGRQPLALLIYKNGTVVRAFPIVHFNLRYLRVQPTSGGGLVRHLFL